MQACDSTGHPPFFGWLILAVVGALLTGGIIGCVALGIDDDGVSTAVPGTATAPQPTGMPNTPTSAPTDTPAPTVTPADTPTSTPTELPSPTPTEVECPTDPSQWTMIPYEMPASDQTLYKTDPPCVMEQVEQQIRECLVLRSEAGRNWSLEDHERCYSPSGFTKPLTGETLDSLSKRTPICGETVGGSAQENSSSTPPGKRGWWWTC